MDKSGAIQESGGVFAARGKASEEQWAKQQEQEAIRKLKEQKAAQHSQQGDSATGH